MEPRDSVAFLWQGPFLGGCLELCLRSKTEPWDFILACIPSSKTGPHTCRLSKVAFWLSNSRSVSLPDSLARAPVWDSRGLMNCNLQSSGTASQKEMSTLLDLGINVLLKSLPCKSSGCKLALGSASCTWGPDSTGHCYFLVPLPERSHPSV